MPLVLASVCLGFTSHKREVKTLKGAMQQRLSNFSKVSFAEARHELGDHLHAIELKQRVSEHLYPANYIYGVREFFGNMASAPH